MLNPRFPKLVITGYAQHGKDTVCNIIKDHFCIDWMSSSQLACNIVVYPALSSQYPSRAHCYEDRRNHRSLWFELIRFYNRHDRAKLAREIFKEHNLYCGLRSYEELQAAKKAELFDMSIWVDALDRGLPPEPPSSISITRDDCDIVLSNNGTLDELREETVKIVTILTEYWADRYAS